MRFFQHILMAASLGLFALGASAAPDNPVNGVDFRTLEPARQTESSGKVEVIEFFWYACPHCHAFEAPLNDWVKKQGDAIVFKRVPVQFGQTPEQQQRFVPQQKLYYALEAMGKLDTLHQKVFDAIHGQHQPLMSDAAIADFIEKQGMDKKAFLNVYNSFSVQTKARHAAQLQHAYKIDGVPMIAIGGRYLTAPSMMGASLGRQPEPVLTSAALQVMNQLVTKAGKEQSAPTNAAIEAKK